MSVVVVDEATKAKLLAAGPGAEIRDEAGNLIGRFGEREVFVMDTPWPSEEEIQRRLRDERSYTPEQVTDRLRELRGKA